MNWKCFLFGHDPRTIPTGYESSVDACERCGSVDAPYQGGDEWTSFDFNGVIGTIRLWYYRLTQPIRHRKTLRCEQCNKRLGFFGKRYSGRFCNQECYDNWLPF